MRSTTKTRGALALFLVVSLVHLSSISASGGDLKNLSRPSLKPVLPEYLTETGRLPLAAQPLGVAATVGTVAWKNLQQATPSWICTTGENSSVTLDLKTAGKVSILEQQPGQPAVPGRRSGVDAARRLAAPVRIGRKPGSHTDL